MTLDNVTAAPLRFIVGCAGIRSSLTPPKWLSGTAARCPSWIGTLGLFVADVARATSIWDANQ